MCYERSLNIMLTVPLRYFMNLLSFKNCFRGYLLRKHQDGLTTVLSSSSPFYINNL